MRITFRRQKGEVGTSTGSGRMTDERLLWHFWNWAAWMRGERGVRGAQCRSVGLSSGGGYEKHVVDLEREVDLRVARTCDVVIGDLPHAQQMAISNEYLNTVYRFLRTTQAEQIEKAREAVRAGLERKGVW